MLIEVSSLVAGLLIALFQCCGVIARSPLFFPIDCKPFLLDLRAQYGLQSHISYDAHLPCWPCWILWSGSCFVRFGSSKTLLLVIADVQLTLLRRIYRTCGERLELVHDWGIKFSPLCYLVTDAGVTENVAKANQGALFTEEVPSWSVVGLFSRANQSDAEQDTYRLLQMVSFPSSVYCVFCGIPNGCCWGSPGHHWRASGELLLSLDLSLSPVHLNTGSLLLTGPVFLRVSMLPLKESTKRMGHGHLRRAARHQYSSVCSMAFTNTWKPWSWHYPATQQFDIRACICLAVTT